MPTLLKLDRIDEVSLVDASANPLAKVLIMKRGSNDPASQLADLNRRVDALSKTAPVAHQLKEAATMAPSISETILKSLQPDVTDSDRVRLDKAVTKMALASGHTSVEKVSAELALEGLARTIQKRDGCSFEAGYVKALDDPSNRDLVRLLA